ncbi:MAG TPA: phosphoenolpyruvate--protein phosphotransferase [Anaeromyxobacteraceae bacterium]|nr:phosphoenolpyruvate--protein phosphotransferase [Anaeromyxobacteraceae bacterium]
MIGLVVVSHSAKVAEGVADLVAAVGGKDLPFRAAGGLELPGRPLGTDARAIARAIEEAYSEEGVLVLMDLGSALLSAQLALDLLSPERRARVTLCEAPIVEGAVAAAVAARLGRTVGEVAAEARGALAVKAAELLPPASPERGGEPGRTLSADAPRLVRRLAVRDRFGLHARPAARLVRAMGAFPEVAVELENATVGRGPASARSINALMTLGLKEGHELVATASGRRAEEALRTLEALFAEASLTGDDESAPRPTALPLTGTLCGVPVAPGVGQGPVRHLPAPAVPAEEEVGEADQEKRRLEAAIERTRADLLLARDAVLRRLDERRAAILDAQLLSLEDEALLGPCRRIIEEEGRSAAAAVHLASADLAARYRALDDDYLRARASDVEGLGRELLAHLAEGEGEGEVPVEPGVLVAAELAASEAARLDPAVVKGLCTVRGGPTSHAAILARALGIPSVSGLGAEVLALAEGTPILVDGDEGRVVPWPSPALERAYLGRAEEARARRARAKAEGALPAVTRDGHRVEVLANVSGAAEARAATALGAEGVGLLRTELLFAGRRRPPSEEEQYAAYRAVAEALEGRPLTVRTLDAGGDKPLFGAAPEANPFLGFRAIRVSLAEPGGFKGQLRAIARLASEFKVRVMFPMIATRSEWRQARLLLEEACREVGVAGRALEVGMMVEVPSAALCASAFAGEADFLSLGTNDLVQYTLAAERGHPRLAALSDPLEPAVLGLVSRAIEAAHAYQRPVSACGEMANDPAALAALVGLGVDALSLGGPDIPLAKARVRRLDHRAAKARARQALELAEAAEVRALLADLLPASDLG